MIVDLIAGHGEIGGGEVMILRTARALRESAWQPRIVCPARPSELADRARAEGFDVVALSARGGLRDLWVLRRWARAHPFDLLWCHGLRPSWALAGIPRRIVHLHQKPRGIQRAAAWVARAGALRTVVPSRFLSEHVRGAEVMGNWSDHVTPLAPSMDRAQGSFTLGYLGRVTRAKGVEILLDAHVHLRATGAHDLRLLVAGAPRFVSTAEAEQVQALLEGQPGVRYEGWSDSTRVLDEVDALVCPSIAPESFGLVAAEAMAAQVPVVVTDAGALPEVVGEEHTLVARAGDSRDLARVLRTVMTMSPEQREDLVHRQYERWERLWSPGIGRTRVLRLLASVEPQLRATGRARAQSPVRNRARSAEERS